VDTIVALHCYGFNMCCPDAYNRFNISADQWIDWSTSQIKISSNQQNLVGTDGNDTFDINYYAAYNGVYFNLGLVQNYFAGGGNDEMGGSNRNDNLWGGTGNDTLYG
jgi:Ca2+-binding RTX toxin-like protein